MIGEPPPLFTYYSGSKEIPDFGDGGVVVLNAQSCKGLEFESVILADVDAYKPKENPDHLRSLFYVMVSRAREQVVMLRTGPVCPVVDALLPDNPAILSRK
jgi:superfamily I DNA/RNA helicase